MDRKRIIFLIIFIVIAIGLGYLMYRVFFAPLVTQPQPTPPPTGTEPSTLPTAREGSNRAVRRQDQGTLPTASPGRQTGTTPFTPEPLARQVVESAVTSPKIGKNGAVNLYNQKDGKFYRLKKDGSVELMSDQIFYQVQNVNWSSQNDEAILEYPDGSNIYYNFDTKKQATLPKHWENFSFSPSGDKIAAKSMALASENRWLITSDPDGNDIDLVEPLGDNANRVAVDWSPNRQVVALSKTGQPLGADRQEVLFIGLHGENFKSITVEGRGIESQWSTDGHTLLYSVFSSRNDFKPELWIVNASGDDIGSGRKILNVNTWANKCTFANSRYVYCAVPNTLPRGAGFAPELSDSTTDSIYRIDTETGLRTSIPTDGDHTIESILVNDDETSLFFTDNGEAGLFEIEL